MCEATVGPPRTPPLPLLVILHLYVIGVRTLTAGAFVLFRAQDQRAFPASDRFIEMAFEAFADRNRRYGEVVWAPG
jgi:hypothetical protein